MMHRLSHALGVCLLLVAVQNASAATISGTVLLCSTLGAIFPNRVVLPHESAYGSATSSYAFLQQQKQKPACIIKPNSALEVSVAVKVLRLVPSIPIAIRSGGHATNKGFSNIDGGVTLDLTSLDAVQLQKDGVTASIGTGATWGDVYPVLDARGRSLNGGRAANVGVGGFLSGGGVGFFALDQGFGCDAVVNMQVVLASGDIVNANATSHKDLFIAIKGGQSNFGIVTRWDIKTVPIGKIWGGGVVYPDTTTAQQLEAFTHWKSAANFDGASAVEQSHVYIGAMGMSIAASIISYTKPVEFPANLKNFTDIQPQISSTLRLTNVTDLANEIQSQSTPNQYTIFATTTLQISPTILQKVHALWKTNIAASTANSAVVTSSMTFQSIPAPPLDASRVNSLGFDDGSSSAPPPQKNLVLVLLTNFWEDPAVGPQVEQAVQDFILGVEKATSAEGLYHRFQYPNYASANWQTPLASTGRLETLRAVAKKYDPNGMFQKQVVGGWKLW